MTARVHDGPPGHGEECTPACPACAVLMAPRRPCAGWHEQSPGRWLLSIGPTTAEALLHDGYWSADVGEVTVASGTAPTLDDAKRSAEDALRAIAVEILRAVGA